MKIVLTVVTLQGPLSPPLKFETDFSFHDFCNLEDAVSIGLIRNDTPGLRHVHVIFDFKSALDVIDGSVEGTL